MEGIDMGKCVGYPDETEKLLNGITDLVREEAGTSTSTEQGGARRM